MKVCFLHPGFSKVGGVERAVSMLMNELCLEDDIEVYSLGFIEPKEKNVYGLEQRVNDCNLYDFKTTMLTALLKHRAIQKTVKYIKEHDIEVIIGCGSPYFLLTVIAAKICGIKSICWEHTNPKIADEFKFQKQIRLVGILFSNANVVITKKALSFYDAKRKRKNYLIYNPIDKQLLSRDVKYDEDSRKIISVGRLVKVKNYDLVVRLCEKLAERYPEWSWDIYGDGAERNHLQEMISKKGLSDFLKLQGNSQEIYKKYDEYSFIVMTSKYEGFPMVLLEASARGLPMVSFDIETGPNEIISDGDSGFLVSDYNETQLLQRIEEMIMNSNLRKSMSISAIEKAKEFRLEKIVAEWERVFKEVLYENRK